MGDCLCPRPSFFPTQKANVMPRLANIIAVAGNGVVGSAIVRGLLEHCGEMRVYDVVPEKRTHSLEACLQADFLFVAVPTNGSADGYDLSHLKDFFGKIRGHQGIVVLKSTVLPGTTDWLAEEFGIPRLVFSPEHLTARCALADFQSPSRNVVGYTSDEQSVLSAGELVNLYKRRFPGVPCFAMKAREAELSKLAINTMFALKVIQWNQVYDVAKAMGCDFERVREAILTDGRITHSHTQVITPLGRGLYGYCLPKEQAAFAKLQEILGLDSRMVNAAVEYNQWLVGKESSH